MKVKQPYHHSHIEEGVIIRIHEDVLECIKIRGDRQAAFRYQLFGFKVLNSRLVSGGKLVKQTVEYKGTHLDELYRSGNIFKVSEIDEPEYYL